MSETNTQPNNLIEASNPSKRQCIKCEDFFNASSFSRHKNTCPFAAFDLTKTQLLQLQNENKTRKTVSTNLTDEQTSGMNELKQQVEDFRRELATLKQIAQKEQSQVSASSPDAAEIEDRFRVFRSSQKNDVQVVFLWTEYNKFLKQTERTVSISSGNVYISRLNEKVKEGSMKASSAKTYRSILNSILTSVLRHSVTLIKTVNAEKGKEMLTLSKQQVLDLLYKVLANETLETFLIFYLCFRYAARINSVVNVKWQDFDLSQGYLVLKDSKTCLRGSKVKLNEKAVKIMRSIEKDKFIFPTLKVFEIGGVTDRTRAKR